MKVAILATIFTLFVVVSAETKCSSNNDCQQNECCIARGIFAFRKGTCTPRAQNGESCSFENDDRWGKYQKRCPCDSGLKCVPEKIKDLGLFEILYNPRCISETTSVEPTTETSPEETREAEETTEPVEETEVPDEE